jgi:sialate O-acetylesterase
MKKATFYKTCGYFLLIVASPLLADVRLPSIIGDDMVLQQNIDVPIWGWSNPGEAVAVQVSWLTSPVTAKADQQGTWMVNLKTPQAGGPYTITIKGENTVLLKNVMVGEVWICAGQSNMEMGIGAVNNAEQEIKAANYPNIRLFHVKRKISSEPVRQTDGKWYLCSPESISSQGDWAGFSAAGYFFGREIHRKLNIPIGLIQVAWGGTPAEAWISRETLLSDPDFEPIVKKIPQKYSSEEIRQSEQELEQWFKRLNAPDPGEKAGWMNPDMDEQGWKTMQLPQTWENAGLWLDGVVWFRKNVTIPSAWVGKELILELGPIDDKDTTWVNGKEVGQTNSWDANREYRIPSLLISSEKNVIAVRVFDSGGQGGIYGAANQLKFYPAGGSAEKGISLAGDWLYKVGVDPGTKPELKGQNPNKPTVLYNGMITPLIPYGIRGVVWYQGESNAERAFQYRKLFPAVIKNWRTAWNQGDFPFYFVQIAPFNSWYKPFEGAELREAQLMALSVPNTGMAITSDIGNLNDVHPQNKQEVGRRLTLWALAKTYGHDIVYSGPLYKSMRVEDDKIRIFFNYSDGGLMTKGPRLTCFTIAGSDRRFVEAEAVIDGNTVVVSSDKVKHPVAVRFAWSNTDEPNLFNKADLPASLFRTDDWPGVTIDKRDPSF